MARPFKLTQDVQDRLVKAIGMGATYELATDFAGIGYSTFFDWMKKGNDDSGAPEDDPHRVLYLAVKRAQGEAALRWLTKIEDAANETWQAAAWKLERRYPQEYGRRVVDSNLGGSIRIEYVSPVDDNEEIGLGEDEL
jgi:hypothetical protein